MCELLYLTNRLWYMLTGILGEGNVINSLLVVAEMLYIGHE